MVARSTGSNPVSGEPEILFLHSGVSGEAWRCVRIDLGNWGRSPHPPATFLPSPPFTSHELPIFSPRYLLRFAATDHAHIWSEQGASIDLFALDGPVDLAAHEALGQAVTEGFGRIQLHPTGPPTEPVAWVRRTAPCSGRLDRNRIDSADLDQ